MSRFARIGAGTSTSIAGAVFPGVPVSGGVKSAVVEGSREAGLGDTSGASSLEMSPEKPRKIKIPRGYLRIAFNRIPSAADTRDPGTRVAQKTISLAAPRRLDLDVYKYPVEIWLRNKLKERMALSKSVVGARRLANTPAEAAC